MKNLFLFSNREYPMLGYKMGFLHILLSFGKLVDSYEDLHIYNYCFAAFIMNLQFGAAPCKFDFPPLFPFLIAVGHKNIS